MSVRNKGMADGFNKSLQPCLSLEMESSWCLWVGKRRRIVPGRWQEGRPFLCESAMTETFPR